MWHSITYAPARAGFLFAIAALALGGPVTATGGDGPIAPAPVTLQRPVDFALDIYPILEANCLACHNISKSEGELVVENVKGLLAGGDSGEAVVPGEPAESLLYMYASRDDEPAMPPLPNKVKARALTPEQLGLIRQWILEGAKPGKNPKSSVLRWQPVPQHIRAIHAVTLSPDSRFVAFGRANQLYVYDRVSQRAAARLVDPRLTSLQYDGQPMYPSGAAHRDLIHSLAFSPTEALLASGGYRVVKLWRRPEGVARRLLAASAEITALAASTDGKWLAFGQSDGAIQLWSLAAGRTVTTMAGHAAPVSCLQFATDGKSLYSGSRDQTIRSWEIPSGKRRAANRSPSAVNSLALADNPARIISAHEDHVIRVWSVDVESAAQEGQQLVPVSAAAVPLIEMRGHGQAVSSVAVIPGDAGQIVSGSADGTVRLWELGKGRQVRSLAHGGPVTAVAVRADGKVLASAGTNGVSKVWDVSGKLLAELKGTLGDRRGITRLSTRQVISEQRVRLSQSALAAAEKEFAALKQAVTTARQGSDKTGLALQKVKQELEQTEKALALATQGLAEHTGDAARQKKVAEHEAAHAKQADAVRKADAAHHSSLRAVEFAEAALKTGEARLAAMKSRHKDRESDRDRANAQLKAEKKAADESAHLIRSIAFSSRGTNLVTADDAGRIQIWDVNRAGPLEMFGGGTTNVGSVLFGEADGLVYAAGGHEVTAWEADPAWRLVGQLGPPPEEPLKVGLSPFADRVLALGFGPNGKLLAAGGGRPSRSGELTIWNVAKQARVRRITDAHSDTVCGVEFSRDGRYLVSGGADKFAKVFEVRTGSLVRSLEGHTHHVLGIGWKADGSQIASAGADHVIKVWDVESGRQLRTISGNSKEVTSVHFVGTSDNLVTCGGDRSVRLYHATDGKNYRSFAGGTDYMYAAAAAPNGKLVVAGGEDGVLRIWNGDNGQVIKEFGPDQP